MPTTVEIRANAPEIGAQVGRMVRKATEQAARPPARPIAPQPLWKRRDLFQEPTYLEGIGLLEDENDDLADTEGW